MTAELRLFRENGMLVRAKTYKQAQLSALAAKAFNDRLLDAPTIITSHLL